MKRALLLTLTLSAALVACTPPSTGCRCQRTNVARSTEYSGALAAPAAQADAGVDAGTPTGTRVTMVIEPNGKATLRFERSGHVVVEAFDAVAAP